MVGICLYDVMVDGRSCTAGKLGLSTRRSAFRDVANPRLTSPATEAILTCLVLATVAARLPLPRLAVRSPSRDPVKGQKKGYPKYYLLRNRLLRSGRGTPLGFVRCDFFPLRYELSSASSHRYSISFLLRNTPQ